MPSRGVRWESGLEPPPHLVGERARALDVLAARRPRLRLGARARGAVTASARRGPRRSTLAPGRRAGHRRARRAARPRRLRAGRAGRGARPVRRPRRASSTSSRRPAASRSASSSSATRSRRSAPSRRSRSARSTPSTRRSSTRRPSGASTSSSRSLLDDDDERGRVPGDLVPPLAGAPDLVWQPDEVRARLGGGGHERALARGRAELDPLPQGQPFAFEAQRPALAARGLAEAENELQGFVRAGHRVVVAFPHRGEALRHPEPAPPRRRARCSSRATRFRAIRRSASPSRPRAAASSGASSGSRCCPDTQVFRKRAPRGDRADRPRAPVVRRPAHRRLRRPRGPRRRQAARLRDEEGRGRHARLPVRRLPRRRPALRPARADRQGLALRRRRRAGARALEARRQGVAADQERARASRSASSPAS